MTLTNKIRAALFANVRADVLAGLTTVLALIPDSLAFAFIAGVNPMISIYSTICILLLTSIFGGRPAMVSSTAGSMAVLMTALVALIFLSQLRYFRGESWLMYGMVAGTLAIVYLLPKVTKAIPSPLAAVVLMTVAAAFLHLDFSTVGNLATIESSLPSFHFPNVPFTFEALWILLPVSFSLAIVGYSETLLTQTIIDEMTEEKTSKDKEMKG